MPEVEFVASDDDDGVRVDVVLARRAGVTRAVAARAIAAGAVEAAGAPATKSLRLRAGVHVRARLPEPAGPPQAEAIDVRAVFEDDWLVVISKPAGLVVHPAPGHLTGTVVNALLARAGAAPAGGDEARPGIVHRLDAGTSGLMIVAKDAVAHERLVEAMGARRVTRVYLTLVEGLPDADTMTVDAPIGRSPRHRKKMAVVANGRSAITRLAVLERHVATAFVEARPETGRTHQIRVHLAAADHAVVGDPVYGRDRRLARQLGLERPFLHAAQLVFEHPMTGEALTLEDPLPPDLSEALARAREA